MTGEVSPAGPPGSSGVPAGPVGRGELRASHTDRDAVVELLRVAAGDGRLTAEELDERLELALTARTYSELAALTADLPAAPGAGPIAAPGAAPEPRELIRMKVTSGNAHREGRWVVPQRMECNVTSGNIKLDFTDAVLTGRTLRIDAEVRSGNLTLITKPGIVVDADDVTIGSGNVKVRAPWGTAAPELLRIELAGRVRSGNITARPPRRTFWQWLTRAPRPYAAAIQR
ncbi:MAG TPA: DUF1707 domain-containing protein [Streptosporangiaceae bacterium]|nr:DUF1707 domain-containing protein [Streptosporangiaceae bacterium]